MWPRHSDQGPALENGLIYTLLAWQRGKLRDAGLAGFDVDDDPSDFVRFKAWGEDAFAHKDDVEVVFRSFELDPQRAKGDTVQVVPMLAGTYGMSFYINEPKPATEPVP